MLDGFEDTDLGACSDTWEKTGEYNVFSNPAKKEAGKEEAAADPVLPEHTPEAIKS